MVIWHPGSGTSTPPRKLSDKLPNDLTVDRLIAKFPQQHQQPVLLGAPELDLATGTFLELGEVVPDVSQVGK